MPKEKSKNTPNSDTSLTYVKNVIPNSNFQNNFKTFYNGNRYNYDIDFRNLSKNQVNLLVNNNLHTDRLNKFVEEKIEDKKKSKSQNQNYKNKNNYFNPNVKAKNEVTGQNFACYGNGHNFNNNNHNEISEPKVIQSKLSLENKIIIEEKNQTNIVNQKEKNQLNQNYIKFGGKSTFSNQVQAQGQNQGQYSGINLNMNHNSKPNSNFQLPNIKNIFFKK
jgi:hypothetical protein